MKKQLYVSASARKLSLGKKTISNLNSFGSNAGAKTGGCPSHIPQGTKNCTQNQNTCPGHDTCYNC